MKLFISAFILIRSFWHAMCAPTDVRELYVPVYRMYIGVGALECTAYSIFIPQLIIVLGINQLFSAYN